MRTKEKIGIAILNKSSRGKISYNNHELQTYFTMQLVPMLRKHNKQLMGWEEIMTKDMSKSAIIHSWKGINEGLSKEVLL
jgi:N-acetyl-beta-hexosaminidase